jgi:esterase/lipase superfamily enzyme
MQENYHKWYTQFLNRDFEMLVFGSAGYPVILFPSFNGKYYESKDNGLIDSVAELIDQEKIKVYCPDTIDSESWDNYAIDPGDRVRTHNAYEKVILNDVIEFAKFETRSKTVCVAGYDFGGYHALNLAFRYPEKVNSLISMSGTFDIKPFIYGFYDDNCYYNNPPDYLSNLEDQSCLDRIKKINITLGTCEFDRCLEENKNMSRILSKKNIPHLLEIKSGSGHNLSAWKEMLPQFLPTAY